MSENYIIAGVDYNDIKASVEAQLGSTPDGWSGLVSDLFESIKARCDELEIEYPEITQIKEKFGALRIYQKKSSTDETICGWISATIQQANHTCEKCGNAAQTQRLFGSSYATLCCFCGHEAARHIFNPDRRRLFGDRKNKSKGKNICTVCCYVGQIDRTDSRGRCPACVKKGW